MGIGNTQIGRLRFNIDCRTINFSLFIIYNGFDNKFNV